MVKEVSSLISKLSMQVLQMPDWLSILLSAEKLKVKMKVNGFKIERCNQGIAITGDTGTVIVCGTELSDNELRLFMDNPSSPPDSVPTEGL